MQGLHKAVYFMSQRHALIGVTANGYKWSVDAGSCLLVHAADCQCWCDGPFCEYCTLKSSLVLTP